MDMDWTQSLTIIFTVFGMLLAFVIYLMSRIDSNQKESNAKFEQLLNKIDSKFDTVNTRFNALENRLTAVEVEIKSTNQRLSTIESFLIPRNILPFEGHHKEDHEEPKEN
jgi:hypothetical protein